MQSRSLPLFAAVAAFTVGGVAQSAAIPLESLSPQYPAFKHHGFQGEDGHYVPHLDDRGEVLPSAAQLQAADNLGAIVRFGPNGTPKVITRHGEFLSGPRDGTPEAIARDWLKANSTLFGLMPADIDAMETLVISPLHESPDYKRLAQGLEPSTSQVPHVVLLRQVFDGIRVGGREGLVNVTLSRDGRVAFVGSTLSRFKQFTNTRQIGQLEALLRGARDVNLDVGVLEPVPNPLNDFLTFSSSVLADVQRLRPRAMPTADGLRHVWEVTLLDSEHTEDRGHPQAFIIHLDAETGKIWTRDNQVQHFVGEPAWRVFPNVPNAPIDTTLDVSEDTRQYWCWNVADNETDPTDDSGGLSPEICEGPELREMLNRAPWDETHLGVPTFTTHGNNASTAVSQAVFIAPDTVVQRPVSPTRNYDFEWTNSWFTSSCDPLSFFDPTQNFADFEAATANLFAMHNRMHDWSYLLGWIEVNSNLQTFNFGNTPLTRANDPELGQSQAGRLTILGRDNANQLTLQDGIPGITNQYLWQSLPGAIYAPCVDGAYDMAIIAHEYTHATTNRMTAGPDGTLGGGQAGNMGEAWSDLAAIEFLQGFDYIPIGNESPFALAYYVTGDAEAGIRNYGIDKSPLNFSNFQYDPNGLTSPHADSEIYGATQFSVRQALIEKYEAQFPFGDKELQRQCAEGIRSSHACPGNRRWVQLMFDGYLIQPGGPSMIDNRDAMLAADLIRYDGENQREMWDAYAFRGKGANAFSAGTGDTNPRPDFSSPVHEEEADITFNVVTTDGGTAQATIYAGRYEARSVPIADNNPNGGFPAGHRFVAGTYEFLVQANGYGLNRFTETFAPNETRTVDFVLRPNVASTHQGAVATGVADTEADLVELIDDTETTNWQSTDPTLGEGKAEGEFVAGRAVTVRLKERTEVTDINVSAFLTPQGQNRFTALRAFDIAACDSSVADCNSDAGFSTVYSSPDDAFEGGALRPKAPRLQLKSFDIPDTVATHIRIITRTSQCTGAPQYQRETNPSGDPLNDPDCDTGFSAQLAATGADVAIPPQLPPTGIESLFNPSITPFSVRISELQVFGTPAVDGRTSVPGRDTPARSASTRGGALGGLMLALLALTLVTSRRRRGLSLR